MGRMKPDPAKLSYKWPWFLTESLFSSKTSSSKPLLSVFTSAVLFSKVSLEWMSKPITAFNGFSKPTSKLFTFLSQTSSKGPRSTWPDLSQPWPHLEPVSFPAAWHKPWQEQLKEGRDSVSSQLHPGSVSPSQERRQGCRSLKQLITLHPLSGNRKCKHGLS